MASPATYLQPLQRAQSQPTPSPQPMDSGASPLGHHLSSSLCSPQVLDLERERQIRPNRRCQREMIEAATSAHLLPCTGGGIGEERSNSHSRRGAGEREQQQPQQEAVLLKQWSVPSPPLSSSGRRSSQDESTTPLRETTMGHGAEVQQRAILEAESLFTVVQAEMDVLLKTISVWFSSHFPCDLKLIQTVHSLPMVSSSCRHPTVSSRWRGCGRIPINFSCMWSVSNYTGRRTSFSFLLLSLPPSCLLCGC